MSAKHQSNLTAAPRPPICFLANQGRCAGAVAHRYTVDHGRDVCLCDGHARTVADLVPGIVPAIRARAEEATATAAD